jgi:hypothetical protein
MSKLEQSIADGSIDIYVMLLVFVIGLLFIGVLYLLFKQVKFSRDRNFISQIISEDTDMSESFINQLKKTKSVNSGFIQQQVEKNALELSSAMQNATVSIATNLSSMHTEEQKLVALQSAEKVIKDIQIERSHISGEISIQELKAIALNNDGDIALVALMHGKSGENYLEDNDPQKLFDDLSKYEQFNPLFERYSITSGEDIDKLQPEALESLFNKFLKLSASDKHYRTLGLIVILLIKKGAMTDIERKELMDDYFEKKQELALLNNEDSPLSASLQVNDIGDEQGESGKQLPKQPEPKSVNGAVNNKSEFINLEEDISQVIGEQIFKELILDDSTNSDKVVVELRNKLGNLNLRQSTELFKIGPPVIIAFRKELDNVCEFKNDDSVINNKYLALQKYGHQITK